jgi:uncharacterized protein YndB with AHSA1/START domain
MSDTRAFEMTIEIAVSPDALWQALTNAEDLVRWFPTQADITPGKGGKWLISWDGNWSWQNEIEIWEPNRHLRVVDRTGRPYDGTTGEVKQSVAPLPIAMDWILEGKGGSTTLRFVHSGFGRGSAWDDEFDGISTGWPLELNGLKHYLEHHRGRDRQFAWTRSVLPMAVTDLWSRVVGEGGIVPDASVLKLRPGDRIATTLSTGDRIEGTVELNIANRALQVVVEGWNNALFRVWVDRVGSEAAVNSWLSTYNLPESVTKEFGDRVRAELERLASAASVG